MKLNRRKSTSRSTCRQYRYRKSGCLSAQERVMHICVSIRNSQEQAYNRYIVQRNGIAIPEGLLTIDMTLLPPFRCSRICTDQHRFLNTITLLHIIFSPSSRPLELSFINLYYLLLQLTSHIIRTRLHPPITSRIKIQDDDSIVWILNSFLNAHHSKFKSTIFTMQLIQWSSDGLAEIDLMR